MTRRFDRIEPQASSTTRRRFVQGLAAGGLLVSAHAWPAAQPAPARTGDVATLRGTDFDLAIGEAAVSFTGRRRTATVVNGSLPAPILRWREGDTVTLNVRNDLDAETSIHWHGLQLPYDMDGVPGVSFDGIAPGATFTYRFPVRQSGTYWYHAHSGFQEQAGLYGALIIDPHEPEPFAYDREHVVLLSDWTDRDPVALYRLLKRQSGYFNYNDRTLGDFVRESRNDGFRQALGDRLQWARMRMKPSDLADVGGHAYTYLVNGKPPAANWTGSFAPRERVRLRLINGSAMTTFDVRIPGLAMTVIAADGQHVHPVEVDEIRLAAAETFDVIVTPSGADAFTIFAQSADRAGFARATLAAREGAVAAVPELDSVQYLTMADMGHAHGGHAAGAAAPAGEEHAGHATAPTSTTSEHAGDATDRDETSHAGHASGSTEVGAGGGHDHAGHEAGAAVAPDHSGHEAGGAAAHDHSGHEAGASAHEAGSQTHPDSEANNPAVDMQTAAPSPRLDDPGVGLRDNGRRVLTYAALRSAFAEPDARATERTIELHLTGNMDRFMWSFDGVPFSQAKPIELRFGERVRFVLVNDTMMEHPIHLHGLWSDLEDEDGRFLVRKHTINFAPGTKRTFRVTADAPGPWAFHCHLLFHMEAGMFRVVQVGQPEDGAHDHAAHHHG